MLRFTTVLGAVAVSAAMTVAAAASGVASPVSAEQSGAGQSATRATGKVELLWFDNGESRVKYVTNPKGCYSIAALGIVTERHTSNEVAITNYTNKNLQIWRSANCTGSKDVQVKPGDDNYQFAADSWSFSAP
ncbi:hypothetical protein ACFV6F_32595 [Kitasatospora phosalacinea]|uniref:hypothetical protein n=1 Tax=Kitasatospora phosalacinea TaxID=2065 RepID=UPI003666144F